MTMQDVSVRIHLNAGDEMIVIPATWAASQAASFTLLLHGAADLLPQASLHTCEYIRIDTFLM